MASLSIRVQPRSSKRRVVGLVEGFWRISLTSPPVDGKANEELIRFLAKLLAAAPSAIEVTSGAQGRIKRISIHGMTNEEVEQRLRDAVEKG